MGINLQCVRQCLKAIAILMIINILNAIIFFLLKDYSILFFARVEWGTIRMFFSGFSCFFEAKLIAILESLPLERVDLGRI